MVLPKNQICLAYLDWIIVEKKHLDVLCSCKSRSEEKIIFYFYNQALVSYVWQYGILQD